jgi:cysteine-rich repeat protein
VCKLATCGDGFKQPGEQCDDGANNSNTGACTLACNTAACGDTFVQAGVEECDDGNMSNTDACTATCKTAKCGDMFVQQGVEQCDDGNMVNTDACLNTCKTAACGDGVVQQNVEQCDDGNLVNTDACTATCKTAVCGDGIVRAGVEQCDDGNQINNDACNNMCMVNPGQVFSQAFVAGQSSPNQCTAWNNWRGSLAGPYTKITLRGSNDPVGSVCNGAGANTLCQALKNNQSVSVACDGKTYRTGQCGGGIEITTTAAICFCDAGYTVRPCIGNLNWGGINGPTCGAANQTLEVVCQ